MEEKVLIEFTGSINAKFEVSPGIAAKLLVTITSPILISQPTENIDLNYPTKLIKKDKRKKHVIKSLNTGGALSIREEIKNLDIVPELLDYPNFHELPSKSDQILWILAFCKNNSIESLSSTEISYIADRLSINMPTNNLSGLTETSRSKGRIIRDVKNNFKIYKPGLDHLKSLNSNKSEE